ncbi:hypothetical protein NS506_05721 [Nocardia seriolae]|uniref:Uncharacterized protein n=1 Tax=Nocardia seriolae TaxID=37332 RepID=A0ABC8AZK6_9NOCA|nr:hypothetical protein NS506_05721 [Nocardia seriolae]
MRRTDAVPIPLGPWDIRRGPTEPADEAGTGCAAPLTAPAAPFGSGRIVTASAGLMPAGAAVTSVAMVAAPRSAASVSAGGAGSRTAPSERGICRSGWGTGEVGGWGVGIAPPAGDGGRDACPASSVITWGVGRLITRLGAPRPEGPSSRRGEWVSAASDTPRRGSSVPSEDSGAATASVAASRVCGAVVPRLVSRAATAAATSEVAGGAAARESTDMTAHLAQSD